MVPRKTSFGSFSRHHAGLVYWGKGYESLAYVTGGGAPCPTPHLIQGFSRFPYVITDGFDDQEQNVSVLAQS